MKTTLFLRIVTVVLLLIWIPFSFGQTSNNDLQRNSLNSNVEESNLNYEPPRIVKISGEAFQPRNRTIMSGISNWDDYLISVLANTWWKILIWVIVFLLLFCLCCYVTRCCYLWWDCCTDPFWGCLPRCAGCKDFLLLRCCDQVSSDGLDEIDEPNSYYQIRLKRQKSLEEGDKNEEEVLINSKENSSSKAIITNNVNKNSYRNEIRTGHASEYREGDNYNEGESLPQVHDTHYFNFMQIFKRREYDLAGENEQLQVADNNQESSKKSGEMSMMCSSITSNSKSHAKVTNQKNDIVIEHGYTGKYHPLPEAQSELISVQIHSPEQAKKTICQGINDKRLSRSMESFGRTNFPSPKGNQCKSVQSQVNTTISIKDLRSPSTRDNSSQTDLRMDRSLALCPTNNDSGVFDSPPRIDNNGSCSPLVKDKNLQELNCFSKIKPGFMEKEILYGKETNILI